MTFAVFFSALTYQWAQLELNSQDIQIAIQNTDSETTSNTETTKPSNNPKNVNNPAFTKAGIFSILSLSLLTVAGSILAALLVSLVTKLKLEVTLVDRGNIFSLLATDSDEQGTFSDSNFEMPIRIVVGKYHYELPSVPEGQEEKRKLMVSVGGKDINWKKPLEFNDNYDIRAAQRIHEELTSLGFRNVTIVNDTDAWQHNSNRYCEILVGLCVNAKVNDALDNMPKPHLFNIEREETGYYSISLATTSHDGNILAPSRDRRHINRPGFEVMLITKYIHHGHVQIIVGGLSDWGTMRAAEVFSERLVDWPRLSDRACGKRIGSRKFSVVLAGERIDYGIPSIQELRVN